MSDLWEAGLGGAEPARSALSVQHPAPCAAGGAGVALSAAGHTPGDALRTWQDYESSAQLLAALSTTAGLLGVCYLLGFLQLPVLRLLEGYWPQQGVLGRLQRRRTGRQREKATAGWERVNALHEASDHSAASALAARLLVAYPPPSRLSDGCRATALGNRLRAAEYYPLERYGVDAVVLWTRLRALLPSDAADRVAGARTALDATVSLLAVLAAFGTVWPIVLVIRGDLPLAAVSLLAWPIAWIAYRAALQAGVSYGNEIRVAFDLHRRLMLRHLDLDVPSDPDEERRLWDSLSQFYQRNVPLGPGTADQRSAAPDPPH